MFNFGPFKGNSLTRRDDSFLPSWSHFFDNDLFSTMNHMQGNFKVDLRETDENYLIEADLPGIKKEAIDIDFHNNYLTISAKRDESMENKQENYVRRERHYGEFRRSFYIDNVDENKIDANFADGVLKIILPKLNKGNDNRRKINIR